MAIRSAKTVCRHVGPLREDGNRCCTADNIGNRLPVFNVRYGVAIRKLSSTRSCDARASQPVLHVRREGRQGIAGVGGGKEARAGENPQVQEAEGRSAGVGGGGR